METSPPRFTLGQFIGLSFAGLAAVLAVLLSVFYAGSRHTVVLAAQSIMSQASRRVTERIESHLGAAERVVAAFESQAALGVIAIDRPRDVEGELLSALAGNPQVTEVALTYGRAIGNYAEAEGPHDAGDLRLDPENAGQISVARSGTGAVALRRLGRQSGVWIAAERRLPEDAAHPRVAAPASDPTLHATFTVPSRTEFKGRALWSDLAFAEADAALPEADRHRVVSVQKALWRDGTQFLGVLRVALASDRIDELAQIRVDEGRDHEVFLCDTHGRLISRLGPQDRFALLDTDGREDPDGDVRVVAAALPEEVRAALHSPIMATVEREGAAVGRIDVAGVPYLVSIAALLGERTQGWRAAIVVPEAHYLHALDRSLRRVVVVAALLMLLAIGVGAIVLGAMRRDLGRLIRETTRLSEFEFAPKPVADGSFRDVTAAAQSLEQAKTALRALGKYVPLDLVRDLYHARAEPVLGGRLEDVTLLFSDIEAFTSLAEELSPNALATALGAYLEAMTRAVHGTGGIIDKYTGDGVMALWNTPRALAGHPRRACEAALACDEATAALFTSPAWRGLPPWRTRFGIHRAEVSVGHFGSPERMSFTAMGDGVNLASRLESLNKQYGTHILVSTDVEKDARDAFLFRRLDRVAVKGRREGVEIYELIGRRVPGATRPAICDRYERALGAYFDRHFDEALAEIEASVDDPPSRVLAARCRIYLLEPPATDWNGVYVATSK